MEKFTESRHLDDYEVWTDSGWQPMEAIHKTIPFQIWIVETENFQLECADEHILFDHEFNEIYAKDVTTDTILITENGPERVTSIIKTDRVEEMYDISVDHPDHRLYTNGILSHNSTMFTIYALWLANFTPDQKILLVANKEATAIEIFQRIRMAYEMLPNWLKNPIDGEYGKTSMVLENGSRISISTTTGTAARGQSVSCLLIDECAHIETHLMDPFWASVFPIVSSSKKSKVFMCSTANGTGNLFYDIYMGALNGTNGWGCDKILWSDVPGRTESWIKATKGGLASEEKWLQEFECHFLNSGTASIDEKRYENMLGGIKDPIEILMDGSYKIWAHPSSDRVYVAGIDTSEGIGGDYSCIKILDITDLNEIEEVAEYYNNMVPVAEFSNICYDILSHWGKPLACVERNNQGGQVVDRLGLDFGYDKIVCWGAKLGTRKNLELLGMISSRNTKIRAVSNARYFYNDRNSVVLRNKASLEELFKDFVKQPNDSWSAVSGKHDDRTMAMIWALMILDKDICELYFNIDEIDECGKPLVLTPLDIGVKLFENPTSLYTNELIEQIENSHLAPISFGSFSHQLDEVSALESDGWEFVHGRPINNPDADISGKDWETLDRWFG